MGLIVQTPPRPRLVESLWKDTKKIRKVYNELEKVKTYHTPFLWASGRLKKCGHNQPRKLSIVINYSRIIDNVLLSISVLQRSWIQRIFGADKNLQRSSWIWNSSKIFSDSKFFFQETVWRWRQRSILRKKSSKLLCNNVLFFSFLNLMPLKIYEKCTN